MNANNLVRIIMLLHFFFFYNKQYNKQTQKPNLKDAITNWERRTAEKRKAGASLREKKWDWKGMRKNEWKTSSRRGTEVYLEFEIEVTAGTLSNPVCLHGFDPVPLWQVCQGIQQRLQEGHRKEDTRKKFPLKFRKSFLPPSLWNFFIYIFF